MYPMVVYHKTIHTASFFLILRVNDKIYVAPITHVNIFCLETRLKRVSFACESLIPNASVRVPSETNEAFSRNLFEKRV